MNKAILLLGIISIYGCFSEKKKDSFFCVGFKYSLPEFLTYKDYDFINKHVNEINDFCIKGEEIPSVLIMNSNRVIRQGVNDFDGSGIGDVFLSIEYIKNYPYLVQKLIEKEDDFKTRIVQNPEILMVDFLDKSSTLIRGYSDSSKGKVYRMMTKTELNDDFYVSINYTVACDSCDIDLHKNTFLEFLDSCSR